MAERRILLATLPSDTHRTPEENLGLEYLAAESRLNGHEVEYIDSWIMGLSTDKLYEQVLYSNPDVLGLSPSLDSINNLSDLVLLLRRSDFKGQIVAGGIYASFEARNLLLSAKGGLTGIITGEADQTFQEYLSRGSVDGLKGCVWQKGEEIVHEPKQRVDNNLDKLPFPDRGNLQLVMDAKTPSHVMGSRGCYGNCSFCSVACFQQFSTEKTWRSRSPQSIVRELLQLHHKGETMVKFVDDNFFRGKDKSRELEIARLIQQSGMNMRFRLSLRANDVSQEVITQLKRAGLFAVSLGVESFVPRKLRDFAKGVTIEQNLRALRVLQNNGIYVQMGHIMFDPFVTLDEIEQEMHYLSLFSWPVTKGICTQLFAAEGTRMTQRIREEKGFIGRDGINNLYEISDPKVNAFYKGLRLWAKSNSRLYDMAIDPISAPKNLPTEAYAEFHGLCTLLRSLDLSVADRLCAEVKKNPEDCTAVAKHIITDHIAEVQRIQDSVDLLYTKYKLSYTAANNSHIY